MITRKEYLSAGRDWEIHRKYYSQFVTDNMKDYVRSRIGTDRLLSSTDRSFNDIPLKEWDDFVRPFSFRKTNELLRQLGDVPTLAGHVCILKEAARQVVEEDV